ncbi:GTP-binding protein [Trueperella pecoris]|uniref:GTP-binding protein n=1 Tax=Trueperella pecoris TaxID=2733571 RepID=A0A7M1R155_9ACTO|nr:GTP-binding protein [Trueperella pecoris]QOR47414.1 GTP-binding protein [Trueperella pecoris]
MQVSLLTTLDPLLRDVVALALSDTAAILEVEITPDGTQLDLQLPSGERESAQVELSHPCITCSIRHAVVPFLEGRDLDRVILALPATVESIYVAPALAEYLDTELFAKIELGHGDALDEPFTLTSILTAVDAATNRALIHATPLGEADLIIDDDERDAGEVLFSYLAHADVILSLGEDQIGRAILRHINPEARFLHGLDSLSADTLFTQEHDVDAAIFRVHPVWVPAAKNMGDGVWTEVLESPRPLDPERLADTFDALATDGLLIRGCYWLPSAPDEIVTWNSSGTSLTVGGAGTWEGEPMTRLVITGTGTPPNNLHRAFGEALAGAIYRY